jgi:hypothetical protein
MCGSLINQRENLEIVARWRRGKSLSPALSRLSSQPNFKSSYGFFADPTDQNLKEKKFSARFCFDP